MVEAVGSLPEYAEAVLMRVLSRQSLLRNAYWGKWGAYSRCSGGEHSLWDDNFRRMICSCREEDAVVCFGFLASVVSAKRTCQVPQSGELGSSG